MTRPFKAGQIVILTRIGEKIGYQGRAKLPLGEVLTVAPGKNWQIPLLRIRRYGQTTSRWYAGDGWRPTSYKSMSTARFRIQYPNTERPRLVKENPNA